MWRVRIPGLSRQLRLATFAPRHQRIFSNGPCPRTTISSQKRLLATPSSSPSTPPRRRLADDISEYTQAVKAGSTATFDKQLIPHESASVFPRIKTTSLSTKRIVIHDEATKKPLTLVLVAFRSFADSQLASWRNKLVHYVPNDSQWFDVTINESFGSQALSGFVQRWQRGRTDPALHDYYVAFNSVAREPLECLLLSRNRMFGYVLLLDRNARVRFRASGMASQDGADSFLKCVEQIMKEDRENKPPFEHAEKHTKTS